MIHYHGLPITPISAAHRAVDNGHAFVSFKYKEQLSLAAEVCQSFALDNGAFSAWKSGKPITDWTEYYEWVRLVRYIPGFDFAVIPDVIDGTEADNDRLLDEWPGLRKNKNIGVGAPVWHMHESLDRLKRLSDFWPRICIGSSGDFAVVGDKRWCARMNEVMKTVCNKLGYPSCKLHGLRMLNPKIFTKFPFSSVDSTNIARNIGICSKWKGTYQPLNKDMRAAILRHRIENQQGATKWVAE